MSEPTILESRGQLFDSVRYARLHNNPTILRAVAQHYFTLGDYEFADMLRTEAALIEITQ